MNYEINMELENIGTNTYLVYKISEEEDIDSLSLGMLTNNHIPALINTTYSQMDLNRYIKFDISARISAERFLSGQVNKRKLTSVIKSVITAVEEAEEYMLNPATLLFDLNYIFVNTSNCDVRLICLPIKLEDSSVNLYQFFRRIMFSVQFDQSENCNYVTKLINYLHDENAFSLSGLKNLLQSIESESPQKSEKSISPKNKPNKNIKSSNRTNNNKPTISNKLETKPNQEIKQNQTKSENKKTNISDNSPRMSFLYLLQHYSKENAEIYKTQRTNIKKKKPSLETNKKTKTDNKNKLKKSLQPKPEFAIPGIEDDFLSKKEEKPAPPQEIYPDVKPMDFGETTVLVNDGTEETTVLNEGINGRAFQSPCLLRIRNNEKIIINKPNFIIGKGNNSSDYVINDNPAISRNHASIITRGDRYYILDLESTNHTYVDDQLISSDKEIEIFHATKIKLADEDFEFKTYY